MSKTIKFKLSSDSIEQAIKELEQYQQSILKKTQQFVKELAEQGYFIANAKLQTVDKNGLEDFTLTPIEFNSDGITNKAIITLTGTETLFVEFGSGSFYQVNHPLAAQYGYGSGTYPGQTHVPVPGYWFYKDKSNDKQFSRGNPSYAPMWTAAQAMKTKVNTTARKIFAKD